jgi:hypothetical protein
MKPLFGKELSTVKKTIFTVIFGLFLGAFALPAFADGNPSPWPTVKDGNPSPWPTVVTTDGNPSPWPKLMTDGNPSPWPKLMTDGNPTPWPK